LIGSKEISARDSEGAIGVSTEKHILGRHIAEHAQVRVTEHKFKTEDGGHKWFRTDKLAL
jgi:hypothetical protein